MLAVALFAAAIAVRWPLIQRGDTLLHFDEAIVGLMAQDIAAGERFPIYFYGQRYMGALEAYVIAGLSTVVHDPIIALRLGPAFFFAALVAVQYLMLTRWFGRRGGLIGAAVLLCGPPMFAQWSVSARGGYIEILLWGTLLLWSYAEWFATRVSTASFVAPSIRRCESPSAVASIHRCCFGAILGSGLWINPSIILFVAPILLHAVLTKWGRTEAAPAQRGTGFIRAFAEHFQRVTRELGRASFPVVALSAILLLNCCWASWVEDESPRNLLLLGIVPRTAAIALLGIGISCLAFLLTRTPPFIPWIMACATSNTAMILGILVGAVPAALYATGAALGLHEMEPSLPLGLRPIWKTGETMIYLLRGLPILFGVDSRPFVDLVTVGRDRSVIDLPSFEGAMLGALNWLAFGALCTVAAVNCLGNRRELGRLLRLQPGMYGPATLLVVGLISTFALYLLGSCSFSFTTIRYLLPLWAFLPGIIAFVFTRPTPRLAARLAPLCLCAVWATGQFALAAQIGKPHPLREVAAAIERSGLRTATAEILDAHLLSYLTGQKCRVMEYEPFWPRLNHYRTSRTASPDCFPRGTESPGEPVAYIVNTHELDRTRDWTDAARPGPPPPETQRFLWPAIHRALIRDPSLLISRSPLPADYEIIRLRRPLRCPTTQACERRF